MSISSPTLLDCKRTLFLARHAMLRIHVVEGELRGLPLRMIVADDGSTLPYIRHLAFPDGAATYGKGVISALKAQRLAESNADIVVVGANHLLLNRYAERGFHLVPKWICPLFPMADDPDTVIGQLSYSARKDIRRNIRLALDKGFAYEATSDPAWFDAFYNDVYLQYGINKHGHLAQLDSYNRVKKAFRSGVGLVVTLEDAPVLAAVVFREGSTLRARYMGVFRGQEGAAFEGGSTAMYYFSMKLAHEWGCDAVNLGSSRPFLSDGVLRFKMKWEPVILRDELSTAFFAITAPGLTQAAQSFLAANPFFEMVGDKIVLHRLSLD